MCINCPNVIPLLQDSWTALHNAAKEGHLEVVSELVGRGASIEAKDMVNSTPFFKYMSKVFK